MLKDSMFAVLISTEKQDIDNYEKEIGFVDKERGILINRLDEVTGTDYMRYAKPLVKTIYVD